MAVIVTGASGHFGRAAAERLMRKIPPAEVILITRNPARLADLAARGAQVRQGDFDAPEGLEAAFAGGDRMLLISTARVGGRVEQHRAAIAAAARAGVRQVAYTSFVGMAPGHPAIVVADHLKTEEDLKASGLAWTFLRDSQYAEAIADAIAPRVLETGQWIAAAGDGQVALVSRDDCVDCAAAVLATDGHENRAYDLTGPELLTFRQAAALVAEVGGRPVDYIEVDDAGMFAMFDALGVPRRPVDDQVVADIPWCSDDMVTFEQAIREGWLAVISDDVERLLGRKPRSLRSVLEARLGQPGS